ncbi:MAG: acetyl-CoA carboxylase, carboxyltransferase subunit beta [Candidatus Wallbacteria bacterium]
MGWFSKLIIPDKEKSKSPYGVWEKCPKCTRVIYKKDLEKNLWVCSQCSYHFRINAVDRIEMLTEPGSFKELFEGIGSLDPLEFTDTEKYVERYQKARKKTGLNDACVTGTGMIGKNETAFGVMDFNFMGGSMGSALGEKITLITEHATLNKLPLIISCTSGGARMQEGILSLMQMAKTSAALARHSEAGLAYITLLTDPTTGGVTASFAMLGDIIISEPGALIGFAGPRVIEQTIKQKLPEGFQRAEFLLEHGIIDMVVPRKELKNKLEFLLDHINSRQRKVK